MTPWLSSIRNRNYYGASLREQTSAWSKPCCQFTRETSVIPAFTKAIEEFKKHQGWQLNAMNSGRLGVIDKQVWEEMIKKIPAVSAIASKAKLNLVRYSPETAEHSIDEQLTVAAEIVEHFSRGRTLGRWLVPTAWKKAMEKWRVRGKIPAKSEEFSAILQLLQLKVARKELEVLWNGLMACNGMKSFNEMGDAPEQHASIVATEIKKCLGWWGERWVPCKSQLVDIGFDWDHFLINSQMDVVSDYPEMRREVGAADLRLVSILENTANHIEALFRKDRISQFHQKLGGYEHREVAALRKAVSENQVEEYRKAHGAFLAAEQRRDIAIKRKALLACLMKNNGKIAIAQKWAEMIRDRSGCHGSSEPPGDPLAAWEWRQLNDELESRSRVDLEALGIRIERIRDRLKEITVQLIDRRAWAAQVRRTSFKERQALQIWLDIFNKGIKKGYGKQVEQLRREAQKIMEDCRGAVPVWIMPLSRIVEQFEFSSPRFDVVIIDEASQCDVMALLALMLARKIVIVGDDEQVSPLAVGQKLDFVAKLIKIHLDGIPGAVLYDGRRSIYDLAKQSFKGRLCLIEHFRCVPDIIQFSNHLCYHGTIKPLREASNSPLLPHVVQYRSNGTYDQGIGVNKQEAIEVTSLLISAAEHTAYQEQTFGVISLLGDEQAYEIEKMLRRYLSPEEYERRRIICGNAAQFQGDERGVVFLSMVHSSGEGPLRFLDRDEFRQRYNVAASRARNQMWVVHSLDPAVDLKPGDLRRRLIEHAKDPGAITRELEKMQRQAESPFEKMVLERLIQRGFRVIPQKQVGCYRIDIVVEGSGKRLGIECDGDRYHPIEKLPEDMERQAILERMGWKIIRLRGSAFFRNPSEVMEQVFRHLGDMGIAAEGFEEKQPELDDLNDGVLQEIIQRAGQLRAAWTEGTN